MNLIKYVKLRHPSEKRSYLFVKHSKVPVAPVRRACMDVHNGHLMRMKLRISARGVSFPVDS